MKNNLLKLMLSLFAIALFIGSCDEVVNQPEVDTDAAQDNALTQSAVSDVFGAIEKGVTGSKSLTTCPTVTFEVATGKLKLDYGTGCVGNGILLKSGILNAQITGYSLTQGWVEGTKAVVSFSDFTLDGKPLTGGITITSHVTGDVKTFKVESADMALTFTDKTKIQWSSTAYMSLMNTDNYGKYWKLNGTSTGTSRKAIAFSNVSENLLSDPRCKWFVGGTLGITVGDNVDVITFGTTCGSVTVKHNSLPAIPLTLI